MSKNREPRRVEVTDVTEQTPETVTGAIIPAPPHNHALVVPRQGSRMIDCPNNLDLTTTHGKAMMLRAMSAGELEVDPTTPLRLVAHHWIVFPDVSEDEETGEISEFIRTCFFDGNGKCFRTSSAHTPRRLGAMLELFTPEEWGSGVPLIISVRRSKRGRLYHDVQIDTEQRFGI